MSSRNTTAGKKKRNKKRSKSKTRVPVSTGSLAEVEAVKILAEVDPESAEREVADALLYQRAQQVMSANSDLLSENSHGKRKNKRDGQNLPSDDSEEEADAESTDDTVPPHTSATSTSSSTSLHRPSRAKKTKSHNPKHNGKSRRAREEWLPPVHPYDAPNSFSSSSFSSSAAAGPTSTSSLSASSSSSLSFIHAADIASDPAERALAAARDLARAAEAGEPVSSGVGALQDGLLNLAIGLKARTVQARSYLEGGSGNIGEVSLDGYVEEGRESDEGHGVQVLQRSEQQQVAPSYQDLPALHPQYVVEDANYQDLNLRYNCEEPDGFFGSLLSSVCGRPAAVWLGLSSYH